MGFCPSNHSRFSGNDFTVVNRGHGVLKRTVIDSKTGFRKLTMAFYVSSFVRARVDASKLVRGGRWEGKPLTEGGKTKNCCLMKIKENCLLFFCSTQKDEISPKMKSESGERENIFLFFLTARNFIKTFLFKSFLIRRVASQKITLPPLPDPKSYLLQLLSGLHTQTKYSKQCRQ